ncbi:hypothetical protein [Pseudomonas sp. 5P_3.1_Bac2]|uniref:hypothetical protein n=1 Tax=Pseudomonas sp. 5P_3.1_Bac2 TaxID=2971617 RepID=UPI0021CA753A|nr:hypothetical protein [Pseudomonas sp. 5P_3.1_Bac2]MCU1719062.1 hypothetical protein [Pseudomonas sp. 5P_3.1_Bac2]
MISMELNLKRPLMSGLAQVLIALLFVACIATGARAEQMDFGGMYGMGGTLPGSYFNNPATNAPSCPAGYTAYQVLGTPNVDWPAFWCGRPHVSGVDPLFDFGGIYAYSSSTVQGAVPWKGYNAYVNPFTYTDTCPPGYSSSQVLGTPNVDNRLYFCYRPHQANGPSMVFAGMTGDGQSPYPNPTTGTKYTCPKGYVRYTAYGTPNVDFAIFYCGIATNAASVKAGDGSLGIGEPIVSNTIVNNWGLQGQIDGILSLHPRVVRMWMLNWQEFTGISAGVVQPNNTNLALYQQAVDQLVRAGVTVVGMDNSYPSWMTGSSTAADSTAIPCPSTGAPYTAFLANWQATWKAQALAFPSISLWEIGNELNGATTLLPIQTGTGSCGKVRFNYAERLKITLDLMYWGSRGVKAGNPHATVFMPAAAPVTADDMALNDLSLNGVAQYLRDIYRAIASNSSLSTNKRDYFDGANWHPYIFQDATMSTWVATNELVHSVLVNNGDGDIPVLLSEDGYTTPNTVASQQAMLNTINLTQTNLPWVKYLIWFRAFANHPDPEFALLVGFPFQQTLSSQVFCLFTGCSNLPYRQY